MRFCPSVRPCSRPWFTRACCDIRLLRLHPRGVVVSAASCKHRCGRALRVSLVLNGAAGIACIVIDADVAPCPSCQSCVSGKTRQAIQREIKEKNRAQDLLANKYKSSTLSPDDIKLCLYSINDNNSFLTQSRDPVSAVPVCPLAHAFASLSAAWWVLCCAVPSRRVVWGGGGVAWGGVGWGAVRWGWGGVGYVV
jgi:hypothetical protein